MRTEHSILLIFTMAAAVSSLVGVAVLFWNAFQAAKRQCQQAMPEADDKVIRWAEGGALNLAQKTLGRMSRVLAVLTAKSSEHNVLSLMDPVDGTAFQEGESITRCACGTNYHTHSWQWLMEKAEGRCVNCKRVIMPQRVLA